MFEKTQTPLEMFKILQPKFRFNCVTDIGSDFLEENNLRFLLLDVDCTLKTYCCEELESQVDLWIAQMKADDITMCILSNGRPHRIGPFAEMLQLPFAAPAFKPFPYKLRRAIRENGFIPEQTAMVGDQVFADVLAANMAGITSILVEPFNPELEPWFARLKRPFERLVLKRENPKKT